MKKQQYRLLFGAIFFLFISCEKDATIRPPGTGDGDSDTGTKNTGDSGGDDTAPVAKDTNAYDTENMPETCGDGILDKTEACDDLNHQNGDGCTGDCLNVEEGWSCIPPGQPCHKMAICGDGAVLSPELCDDENVVDGDGCSDSCKVEIGWKCEGSPSVCTETTCGDGVQEGAESCDDGNTTPFDGCSSTCQKEPDCAAGECASECGDGLVLGEACDDGNQLNGDGCSASCEVEEGYECMQEGCESEADCTLLVDAIFRDFPDSHSDFAISCDSLVTGMVNTNIGSDWKPVLSANGIAEACVASSASFGEWYNNAPTKVEQIVLYPDGNGNFVNRYGEDGEPWVFVGTPTLSVCGAGPEVVDCIYTEDADCATACPDAVAAYPDYICSSPCPNDYSNRTCLTSPNPATCDDCPNLAAGVEGYVCQNPCGQSNQSMGYDNWDVCEYGAPREYYDGNPLFFPLDDVGTEFQEAKVPEQYGYVGWPWESDALGVAALHNFSFTTEITYWFKYEANSTATLNFTGDDDVWVFVNGQMVVDLGGVHVPEDGSVTINAANNFGMEDGGVYRINIFHAERKPEGSSFKLTLGGFNTARSDCTPECGDGVISLGEQCDDGVNDGSYGGCTEDCKLSTYCGDGILQEEEGEHCDDGNFLSGDSCPPSCREIVAE